MTAMRGIGQSAPFSCPTGYTYSNPDNTLIPSSPSASELAELQGAFCVNSSGQYYMAAQSLPMNLAYAAAAILGVLFLPGLWKVLSVIPAYMAYESYRCSASGNNASGCVISL